MWPKNAKILVTNLDEHTPRQVVGASQRRWPVGLINRELKSKLDVGEPQVRGEKERIEKSFGIAMLMELLLSRACHQESFPESLWSVCISSIYAAYA